ncbi:MAG: helix-turn-helix domain-containing protein [Pseudomonadota bacterium]
MESLIEPLKTCHLDHFRTDLRNICGSFDVDNGRDTLTGRAASISKAGLDLAYVGQNAQAIHRQRSNIKADPGNHFFLVIQAKGTARMRQNDSDAELLTGDMFVVDSTQPSSFHYGGRTSHQLSLHLPRVETLQRFGNRISGGMKICRTDPLGQAMRSIVTEIVGNQTPHNVHVAEAFYSVFGAYLYSRSNGDAGTLDPHRQIVHRALSIMSQHFSNPRLCPAQIADLTGVSLRSLQRAFATMDSTPHRHLQDMRVDAFCEALDLHGATNPSSIARIVFDCGFSDLSTFYRLFKTRFGCAPTAWRTLQ